MVCQVLAGFLGPFSKVAVTLARAAFLQRLFFFSGKSAKCVEFPRFESRVTTVRFVEKNRLDWDDSGTLNSIMMIWNKNTDDV